MHDGTFKFSTRAVHSGQEPCPCTGSLATPIYQTSTFVFNDADQGAARFAGEEEGYIYSRLGNPTVHSLEDKISDLEGGEAGLAFASGMAAIAAVLLALVRAGDHLVADRTIYGCTYAFLTELLTGLGVEVTLVDTTDLEEVSRALRPNTRVIYTESLANPTLKVIDLPALAQMAREKGIQTVVDNTFLSPYLLRPLEQGCDVVIHSATKYLGGHGDLIAGVAVGKKELLNRIRMTTLKNMGGVLGPFDAWLLLRGIKTLPLRMERHSLNAQQVARFLAGRCEVSRVYYPGLESHPAHELARKLYEHGFGGVVAFELKAGYEAGRALLNSVGLIRLAVSLGDVDTLIEHPASMTHHGVGEEGRRRAGISDGLVRLSVGIEDAEDIIADLGQALDKDRRQGNRKEAGFRETRKSRAESR